MPQRLRTALLVPSLLVIARLAAVEPIDHLRPLLERHCIDCHGAVDPERGLDYQSLSDAELLANGDLLDLTLFMVEEREMPPAKRPALGDQDYPALIGALEHALAALRDAAPDDPGIVVAPRINHGEYDHVVRDLTGLELGLGAFLVPDNQAGEGFVNVGAAQTMTVGQFEAYLSTAKKLLRHASITPGRIVWSPEPYPLLDDAVAHRRALRERWFDWHNGEKEALLTRHQRALRQGVDMVLGAYLEAAWRYRHRSALGLAVDDLPAMAAAYDVPLLPEALGKLWAILQGEVTDDGNPFLAEFVARWQALPGPAGGPTAARAACRELVAWAEAIGLRSIRSRRRPVTSTTPPPNSGRPTPTPGPPAACAAITRSWPATATCASGRAPTSRA